MYVLAGDWVSTGRRTAKAVAVVLSILSNALRSVPGLLASPPFATLHNNYIF